MPGLVMGTGVAVGSGVAVGPNGVAVRVGRGRGARRVGVGVSGALADIATPLAALLACATPDAWGWRNNEISQRQPNVAVKKRPPIMTAGERRILKEED